MQLSINEPLLKDFLYQKGVKRTRKALLNTDKTKKSAGLPVLFGIFAQWTGYTAEGTHKYINYCCNLRDPVSAPAGSLSLCH